jgi:anti-sigma factor RsiW
MTDFGQLELIHAEIDGELEPAPRAELARRLLADPDARALRDDFRRLCKALDALVQVEPPAQLREGILAALPAAAPKPAVRPRQRWLSGAPQWRYAAVIASVLTAGAIVTEIVRGPAPPATEVAGTMAVAPASTLIDTVRLDAGPVSGSVRLYRDRAVLALEFDVKATAPMDVMVASEGRSVEVTDLGTPDKPAGPRTRVTLPGVGMHGQAVDVTFLIGGHPVGNTVLRAPQGP